MQGFNKYYPPDYNPSYGSLNAYRGKHALGDRARKLDQGILITRFELPFNIWCGTCNNHIGMGVRYNAEKKKVGNYYSTPIYSFRCKCHLCGSWFEIQTDPKNTRYVVVSGARQKEEDWNPEEHGGFRVHDTEGQSTPEDPLAALEKTADAQNRMTKIEAPRLESLQTLSERYNADPYTLSTKVRKRFRQEKKVELMKQQANDAIKDRYGLPSTLELLDEDDQSRREAKAEWQKARRDSALREAHKRQRLSPKVAQPSASTSNPLSALRARILQNTARHSDSPSRNPQSRLKNGTTSIRAFAIN